MTTYLISFPGEAVVVLEEEFEAVVDSTQAVIGEVKAVGGYVFGGGIDEGGGPVLVAADGAVAEGTHPGHEVTSGGCTVLELTPREAALEWAAMFAAACRCPQELRRFGYDPAR